MCFPGKRLLRGGGRSSRKREGRGELNLFLWSMKGKMMSWWSLTCNCYILCFLWVEKEEDGIRRNDVWVVWRVLWEDPNLNSVKQWKKGEGMQSNSGSIYTLCIVSTSYVSKISLIKVSTFMYTNMGLFFKGNIRLLSNFRWF